MKNRKKLALILIFAGFGGVIRQLILALSPDLGLLLVNYTAVYGLVYVSRTLFQQSKLTPDLKDAVGIGFFGGLSTLAPILLGLAQTVTSGDWLGLLVWLVLHVLGGFLLALLANSRALKQGQEGKR